MNTSEYAFPPTVKRFDSMIEAWAYLRTIERDDQPRLPGLFGGVPGGRSVRAAGESISGRLLN